MIDWTEPARTCRFCKKMKEHADDGFVKYSVRHHAHYECYLRAKGADGLKALPAWKVGQFPFLLLKQFDLVNVALAVRHEANRLARTGR